MPTTSWPSCRSTPRSTTPEGRRAAWLRPEPDGSGHQDRHRVVADLDEAALDLEALHGPVELVHARLAAGEGAEERRVVGQEGDLALRGAGDDLRGLALVEGLLRRDHRDVHDAALHAAALEAAGAASGRTGSSPLNDATGCLFDAAA